MNDETRAARGRITAFLDADDTITTPDVIVELHYDDSHVELRRTDLRTMADATAESPVMHAISGLCTWKTCGHAERTEIYRMIGNCANCQGGPYLMLFTVGHERHALTCPACGTQNVRGQRLATASEIGPRPTAEVAT